MALKKRIELKNGIIIDDAYIRIDTISGYKMRIDISVNFYTSQEKFNEGGGYLEQRLYNFSPTVDEGSYNFIKQGYEYLKTLSDFVDSTDC